MGPPCMNITAGFFPEVFLDRNSCPWINSPSPDRNWTASGSTSPSWGKVDGTAAALITRRAPPSAGITATIAGRRLSEQQKTIREFRKEMRKQEEKIGQLETALQFKQDKDADLAQVNIK